MSAVLGGAVLLLRPWQGRADAPAGGIPPAPAARQDSLPCVAVVTVERRDLYRELRIPAEFRPYADVDLHAKVSGYVDRMEVDLGDRVKAGQLLATLEVPELQEQLNGAVAAEQRAEADYRNAHLEFTRLASVNKDHPNLVAQQDLDAAEALDGKAQAALAAAKSDVQRYRALVGYTRITAPFDGVVTRRYADPGALIQAGTASDTQSLPLVRLSDNYRLRLDFPVSVDDVAEVHPGDAVEVRIESLGGRALSGKVTRFARKVEEGTRTMLTELEVDNPGLELVPGMYATVMLRVQPHPAAVAVPVECVSSGRKPVVYVVNDRQQIEERPVRLGLETSAYFEVLSGLQAGDRVLLGNPGQLQPGQKVDPRPASLVASQ